MSTLFVSDVHLNEQEPAITAGFLHFLQHTALQADALYILGDLFDVWIGDDENSTLHQQVATALYQLHEKGIPCYFMQGNRDFLLGQRFAQQCGMQLLPSEYLIELYGQRTLLLHGDTLCTDDLNYQRYRRIVHNKYLQRLFLWLPLSIRLKVAAILRQGSQRSNRRKYSALMDVNSYEVIQTLQHYDACQMIHGHTHQPAIHPIILTGNQPAKRVVLGAWHQRGSMLKVTTTGIELIDFPLTQ